jgi:hypothetical protein
MADFNLLHESRRLQTRSDIAFRARRKKNEENWRAYLGEQDFSYKAEFQSRETTPGFPMAVDHIVGTFERALTDSDDWLIAEPGTAAARPFLDAAAIQSTLQFYLSRLWKPGNHPETAHGIQVVVGDAAKRGILEPRVVFKVWPVLVKRRHYRFKKVEPTQESGAFPAYEFVGKELEPVEVETMRLAIDVIPDEDYFPDPSEACRYEIHRTRKQLHELLANPEYDQEAVKRLLGKAAAEYKRGRDAAGVAKDPFEVEVFEAWGDIIDPDSGELLHENVFWTWAGDEIIRQATPNPFWDGTRPFVVAPLIRVPNHIEGKALADHAVPMWKAMNELVNLLLDQAMRAAWGIGQVRTDIMESPEEVADGIPQGYTAVLKPNTPSGQRFYERVDEGQAPQISLDNLNRLEGFLQEALATPDTKLGQIPQRATKATEIVQAMQSSGSLYESFAARFEDTALEPLFEKCWRLILQYADDFLEEELIAALGPTNIIRLMDLSPAERFKMLHHTHFKVRGLRGLATRDRTFQKMMTVVNLLATNQQLSDHFGQTYDYGKLWDQVLRASGIDPLSIELDEEPEGVEPGSAGGQLDPNLAASSGASQPNVQDAAAAQGVQTQFAPKNPAQNNAA